MTRPLRATASCRQPPSRIVALGMVFAVFAAGCLPSSQRQNDRSLTPSDSASVRLAAEAPVDTLTVVWTATAPADAPMLLPTSIAWYPLPGGGPPGLVVADTQDGSLRFFGADGTHVGRTDVRLPDTEAPYPYLAGVRGDTVVVLARGVGRLAWVQPAAGVVRTAPAPPGTANAMATDSLLVARVGGGMDRETPPALVWLDAQGAEQSRHALAAPSWRAAGFVRMWAGDIVALSGYRPVVDRLPPGASARADTLALRGFDSPQLARSAQFMRGAVAEPPLLTASAAALGDYLYVLNQRTDHIRIDRYGRDGVLDRVLVSPMPWALLDVVAVDLAVRDGGGGAVEMAVLLQRQSGVFQTAGSRVMRFRWTPAPILP